MSDVKPQTQALFIDVQKAQNTPTMVTFSYYTHGTVLSELKLPCNTYGLISPEAAYMLRNYLDTILSNPRKHDA
jgi:hypothetical protein